jgi:OOP family OmpA-OmpF porin
MKCIKLIPVALCLLAGGSWADDKYVVGELTSSNTSLSNHADDTALKHAGATSLSSSDDGNSNQFRIQVGDKFTPNFAVEAGYIDLGKSNYSAKYKGGKASNEVKAGGVDVAALGIIPVTEQISIFGKAGVVVASVKSHLKVSGPASDASNSSTDTVVEPLLGVGATYQLSKKMDIRTEFDHVSNLGKSEKMDSNMFSLGVVYHF